MVDSLCSRSETERRCIRTALLRSIAFSPHMIECICSEVETPMESGVGVGPRGTPDGILPGSPPAPASHLWGRRLWHVGGRNVHQELEGVVQEHRKVGRGLGKCVLVPDGQAQRAHRGFTITTRTTADDTVMTTDTRLLQ